MAVLTLSVKSMPQKVDLVIEEGLVVNLLTEVLSDLNCLGASQFYGENPNLQQLVHHYCQTCAFSRLLNRNQRFIRLE